MLYSSIDVAAGVRGALAVPVVSCSLLAARGVAGPPCLASDVSDAASLGRGRGNGGGVAGSAAAPAPGVLPEPAVRRKAFGARRRRHRRRIRAVALRNHGNRPRRAAVGRPHQRHGVTRRHQRYHLDDAPALRIDDDPDLFTGRIDRAQRVSRALAHRTTQGLKSGGAHDGDDLVRRQSCDRIAGAGISRWRGGLRQGVSRYRKRGDKSRAEGDLVFQDKVPPIWIFPCSPPSIDATSAMRSGAMNRLLVRMSNDSRELGVALALACHQEACVVATKRSTSAAVVANDVTRRTSVVSLAGMTPFGSASVVQG